MKKWFLLLILCIAGTMLSAGKIWDGTIKGFGFSMKMQDSKVEALDNVLTLSAVANGEKYHYLSGFFPVAEPFKIAGKALSLEVKSENPQKNDSVYIKLLNAQKKPIAEFIAYGSSANWRKLDCIPVQKKWATVNCFKVWPDRAAEDVCYIQLWGGRLGKGLPVKLQFRNFELVDAATVK